MEGAIVEFAEVLRQNGVRVALSEVTDALRAVAATGVETQPGFRATLKSVLVKRSADVPAFDRAFDAFFSMAVATLQALEKSLAQRVRESGVLQGDDLEMLLHELQRLPFESALAAAAVRGDGGEAFRTLRGAQLTLDFERMQSRLQTGFFSRRLLTGAGLDRARGEFQSAVQQLQRSGLAAETVQVAAQAFEAILRDIEEAARAMVQQQAGARFPVPNTGAAGRPLATLSRAELRLVHDAVKVLARRLKARLGRRQRSKRRGALNSKATIRHNLVTGGVPMSPRFRKKHPYRPDVVVLCDVSDSVRATSSVMLLFMHTLQTLFARVRSFVFVSELGEISALMKELAPDAAIDLAVANRVVSLASNSNYGNALASFVRHHLGAVTGRTTVLVIGDGRNNYNPANSWALEEIGRKAKRVVWICTEPRTSWGFGDSEMLRYEPLCDQVVTVQTLGDLERAAHAIVPH